MNLQVSQVFRNCNYDKRYIDYNQSKNKLKSVGIIGCGTIGSQLALAVDSRKIDAELVALFDAYEGAVNTLANKLKTKPLLAKNAGEFVANDMDIVVEAASQDAVRNYARLVLETNHDLMIMSVGALLDSNMYDDLKGLAEKHDRRIYLPTGAIAGIDAIRTVKHLLEEVTLTTTKSPKGLEGAPFFKTHKTDLKKIKKSRVIYEGKAEDAVKFFPANVNVAAALSLAGIGGKKTKVRIVADPKTKVNTHEVTAKGSFGEMRFQVKNVPSPTNPKTSYLAVLSAIECLRSICDDRVSIGT
ncbi:MAG: aspartate dehydrogenase [Candidatus Nitrosomirales archaeon]